MSFDSQVHTLEWDGQALSLLDQRALPARVAHVRCESAAEVAEAIAAMVVRGAPAIGVAAAYGVPAVYASHEELLAREPQEVQVLDKQSA